MRQTAHRTIFPSIRRLKTTTLNLSVKVENHQINFTERIWARDYLPSIICFKFIIDDSNFQCEWFLTQSGEVEAIVR